MGSLVVPAAAADVGSSVEPGVSVGALEGRSSQELSVQSVPMSSFNLDQGKELTAPNQGIAIMSADSVTNKYEGTIAAEGQFQYVTFALGENQIVQATLENPQNPALNYDLYLCTVSDTGDLEIIASCTLGTYVDPQTGKTLDDALSYIHTDATAGAYALLVMATQGSSATDKFYLTVSLDTAGSYDANEPNDNPFAATNAAIGSEISGSLNVANDQDWYIIQNADPGVFAAGAGDYKAEIYYATSGNTLALADLTSDGPYTLYQGPYYVKVYSDADINGFVYGDYTLTVQDMSQSSSIDTAYNMGYWKYAGLSPSIPVGQPIVYYRFTANAGDKIYAYVNRYENSGYQELYLLNANGEQIGKSISTDPNRVITDHNNITKFVINIDATQNNQVFYLAVAREDPQNITSSMSILLRDRMRSGYSTFEFSGTAYNSGFSYSNILTLDLTNEDSIAPNAILTDAKVEYKISDGVGGLSLELNPGGYGWFEKRGGAGTVYFDIEEEMGILAHVPYYFRYYQSAFMSTEMYDITLDLDWEYDIQYTGYDEWEP